ncbi:MULTISPECIES: alpha/beta hydrolase [unclassified Amycolatopsis]|uniref:alpha/beta hydrolase n=1 Tax=unclassified Amycolatopsis TaxID=2618356 RepID=UPI001F0DD966|nr:MULTISPECIES: alpha/beta fold hydrolase [unclassified Amycolatopsis]
MSMFRRLIILPVAAACAGASLLASPASAQATQATPALCHEVVVKVRLPSGAAAKLRGELCRPDRTASDVVEVLLAGLTYDRAYWEIGPDVTAPSYRKSMNARGYSTLALDRLGTGSSDRPEASEVSFAAEVDSVHQVVERLKAGLDGPAFKRVVLAGHSFGAGVALGESVAYHDVAGVLLSGYAHAAGPKLSDFGAGLVSAKTDPVLGRTNPPDGYLTTAIGRRAEFFYNVANAAPAAIVQDEAFKSTMTTGEQASIGSSYDPHLAAQVNVPVLIALGQDDQLLCGGQWLKCSSAEEVQGYERQFFTGSARLDAYLLPGAGHAMNLHRNASVWYAVAAAWTASL